MKLQKCGVFLALLLSFIGIMVLKVWMDGIATMFIARIGVAFLDTKHGGFIDDTGLMIGNYTNIEAKEAPNSIVNLYVVNADLFGNVAHHGTMGLHGNIIRVDLQELAVYVVSVEHMVDSDSKVYIYDRRKVLTIYSHFSPTLNLEWAYCKIIKRDSDHDIGFYKCEWTQIHKKNALKSELKKINIAKFDPFWIDNKLNHGVNKIRYYFTDYLGKLTSIIGAAVFITTPIYSISQSDWTKNYKLSKIIDKFYHVDMKEYFAPKFKKFIEREMEIQKEHATLFIAEGLTTSHTANALYHINIQCAGFSGDSIYNDNDYIIALIEAFEDNWFGFWGQGKNRATRLNNDFFLDGYKEITGTDLRKKLQNNKLNTKHEL